MKPLRVVCVWCDRTFKNYIFLEQVAQARDHDTWQRLMEQALTGFNCTGSQSTSDEAPGLLAYVAHHFVAHHSPDLFHGQHELSKAISAPMAAKQRAAANVVAKTEERPESYRVADAMIKAHPASPLHRRMRCVYRPYRSGGLLARWVGRVKAKSVGSEKKLPTLRDFG